jgi:hypothetical protein
MRVTQEQLDWYGRLMCMPLALLINFSLFQYLVGTYYKRRHERYVRLLLFCGFGSFVVLIPLSHPDDDVVNKLNDISEILSVLTFLVQIIMIGKSITRKMNIRSLKCLTIAAELLTYIGILLSLKTLIETFTDVDLGYFEFADNVMEGVSVWFIFGFRFYYMSLSRGFKSTFRARKKEMTLYLLFATHEYPFIVLDYMTGVSWEEVQALWHRVTLGMCLLHTIHAKIKSTSSSNRHRTKTTVSHGPSFTRPDLRAVVRSLPTQMTMKSLPTVAMLRKVSSARVGISKPVSVLPADVVAALKRNSIPDIDS